MDEELNDHDLEGRLYAMLHYADETQTKKNENNQNAAQIIENAPRSTVRRYWRTSADSNTKIIQKESPPANNNTAAKKPVPKAENPQPSVDLSFFQSPPQNLKRTIEVIEHEIEKQVILESSDEDEVVEVALPPKPTITIESSDEDELEVIQSPSPAKILTKPVSGERCVSASPVPSVVSSVSDEFIRGDCIALNISSRHGDDHSFDFSLHGPDLLDQVTPSKKKKKKKSKDAVTSTPTAAAQEKSTIDECFATPKSKAKNKKKKSFSATNAVIQKADVYDSDSNHSLIESNKSKTSYVVTEKSLPNADVYESDSSHSENVKEKPAKTNTDLDSSDSSTSLEKPLEETENIDVTEINRTEEISETVVQIDVIDLTINDKNVPVANSICENIVMANVTGFSVSDDYGDVHIPNKDISMYVSTKVPPILNEDLDFDNLKGKDKVCRKRRYSLTSLRAEMEKFYNESWGGENFNHREIQKNMSRDKSLWAIDPKDKMPSMARRKMTCNYCNRSGHKEDTCHMKPAICHMCGSMGHFEPRCPRKICVNCGSPNHIYSTMCRNCSSWNSLKCAECGQSGHPASHCPDMWRRYHNTIDEDAPLEKSTQTKKHYQLFCSGCTRRGHLIHTCRNTIPFSGLPINSPYVCMYRAIYPPTPGKQNNLRNKQIQDKNTSQDSTASSERTPRNDRKRQSKSPTAHETHVNKKRNLSASDDTEMRRNTKSPIANTPQRKISQSIEDPKNKKEQNKTNNTDSNKTPSGEKAPNFIPISSNYDKRGHIIQDNEVSDTSDAVTSARIYIINEMIDQLKTKEGEEWLKETTEKHNVTVQYTDINSFLSIKGKVADQEAFQSQLRDWTKTILPDESSSIKTNENNLTTADNSSPCDFSVIPKNRTNLLKQLTKALNSLKKDIGDPKYLYKELTYFQSRHQQLLKRKTVSPKQVSNNRCHINEMLKKLNMVLLGQAGLADGSQHLNELYAIQEKLTNSSQKIIPIELRKEIGQHYCRIFAAMPRNDYLDLLKKFYHSPSQFKKKNKDKFKFSPNVSRLKKNMNSIPTAQIHHNGENLKGKRDRNRSPLRQKLVFYHQRLLNTKTENTVLKKTRIDLVQRLHAYIAKTYQKDKIPSKMAKKMKKAQDQAQVFLENV